MSDLSLRVLECVPTQKHEMLKKAKSICKELRIYLAVLTQNNYLKNSFCAGVVLDLRWVDAEHVKQMCRRYYPLFIVCSRNERTLVRQLFVQHIGVQQFDCFSNTRSFPELMTFESAVAK